MSFKYQAVQITPFQYRLETGVRIPIDVFMSEALYNASEESMWLQATWATTIPSAIHTILTADGHTGAAVPIGTVVVTTEHVAPCAAGYDINCGMMTLATNLRAEDLASRVVRRALLEAIQQRVALGTGGHRAPKQIHITDAKYKEILNTGLHAFDSTLRGEQRSHFESLQYDVHTYEHFEFAYNKGYPQLGSLGGGNHFIEIQVDQFGKVWVMIHTGSRKYGYSVATQFFNEGLEWWNATHETKEQLRKGQKEAIYFPVESDIGRRYLNAMNQAANFAKVNRYLIANAVIDSFEEVLKDTPHIHYEISHNMVSKEDGLFVHRKGATRALPAGHPLLEGTPYSSSGHPILIPGSMGTSSAILVAVDSAKSLYSINHGSGRQLPRGAAKRTLDQATENDRMDRLDVIHNNRDVPLDESAPCYKDIGEVLRTVEGAGLAKVCLTLRPIAFLIGCD